jgi:hypothetical protein
MSTRASKNGATKNGSSRRTAAPADPRTDGASKKSRQPKVGALVAPVATDLLPAPEVAPATDPSVEPVVGSVVDTVVEPVVIPAIVPAEPDSAPEVPSDKTTTEDAPSTTEAPDAPEAPPSTTEVPEVTTTEVTNALIPVGGYTDTDGTGGLPSLQRPKKPPRALRAPVVLRKPRRPRVRRVTRVIRQVDTWSVFKVSLIFSLFLYFVCLTAGVLLWQVAQNTGTVDNIERFFESFGWQTFQLHGGEIFHNAWVAGLFLVVGLTGLLVLAATLFNLITDLVGGIRVTVLEEEVLAREDRGTGWRRARRSTDVVVEPTQSIVPNEPV